MSDRPRRRVVVIADWWWPDLIGGAEHCARDIAKLLAASSDVTVVIPSATPARYQDGPVEVVGARKAFARPRHPGTLIRRVVELATTWLNPFSGSSVVREIDIIKPDVTVVTNTSRTGPWVLRALKRRPYRTVRVFHDLSDTCWRRSRQRAGGNCLTPCSLCKVKLKVMKRATPAGTHSVCTSGFVRDDLVSHGLITPEQSSFGYPAISDPAATVERRRPKGCSDDIVLGFIGRLSPVKGIEHAIDVAARLATESPCRVSLVIAGTGDEKYVDSLKRRADDRGLAVDFRGWLPIDEFCASVDVALVPSTWLEGYGRVAVEVGIRGLPVLVSPLGGLPEAVRRCGTPHGFADFADTAAAAFELKRLLTTMQAGDGNGAHAAVDAREREAPSLPVATLRAVTAVVETTGPLASVPTRDEMSR